MARQRMPGSRGSHSTRAARRWPVAAAALAMLTGCSVTGVWLSGGAVTHLDEKLKDRTVTVTAGARLELTLHSTLWTVKGSSKPRVLAASGGPTYPPPAPRCTPAPAAESGCGTVVAWYTALRPGTAVVTATRGSCGEAMRCGPGQGFYKVTIIVTR